MKVIKPAAAQTAGAFSRASTATYVDAAGVVQTAGVNVPRYQAGTLMVEVGAINLALNSADLTAASWSGTATVTPNTHTAPDGLVAADTVTDSSGAALLGTAQSVAVPNDSASYVFSAYVRKTSGGSQPTFLFDCTFSGGTAIGNGVRLNTDTGAVLSGAATTADAGAYWRVMAPLANNSSGNTSAAMTLFPACAAYGLTALDNTQTGSAVVWGVQIELGTSATSYIPTTSGAVGRLSDVYTPGVISNVPETDHTAWVAATAYTAGNRVIRTGVHRIYQRVISGTTATAPESDTVNWVDVGPTNTWAMLDGEVSTATIVADSIKVTLAPGRVTGLALFGLVGSSVSAVVVDGDTGAEVYRASTVLDAAVIQDWWAYVYEPFRQQTEWVLSDLPAYTNARISVVISGTFTACAAVVVGTVYGLGGTLIGPRLGITDYSRKETDEFGAATFVRRAYAKRLTCELLLNTSDLAGALAILSDLRATPAVYIAATTTELNPLLIYGWYRDFGITVAYATRCLCSLDLEGLT